MAITRKPANKAARPKRSTPKKAVKKASTPKPPANVPGAPLRTFYLTKDGKHVLTMKPTEGFKAFVRATSFINARRKIEHMFVLGSDGAFGDPLPADDPRRKATAPELPARSPQIRNPTSAPRKGYRPVDRMDGLGCDPTSEIDGFLAGTAEAIDLTAVMDPKEAKGAPAPEPAPVVPPSVMCIIIPAGASITLNVNGDLTISNK